MTVSRMKGASRSIGIRVMRARGRAKLKQIMAENTFARARLQIMEMVTGRWVVTMSRPENPMIMKAARSRDIIGPPGMPKRIVGSCPADAGVMAASGATSPRISPLLNVTVFGARDGIAVGHPVGDRASHSGEDSNVRPNEGAFRIHPKFLKAA